MSRETGATEVARTGTAAIVHRTTCRVCDAANLEPILSFGRMPLANAFLGSPEEFAAEQSYPLDLYFCPGCSLLQLLDVVDPDVLFRHYLYVTGTSTTQAEHNRAYARTLVERLRLGPGDLVAEVASNDGSLLRSFAPHGVRTLGVEPARNLAAEATAAGVETVNEFFTCALARRLRADRGPARAVVASNVLAHVDDPRDFLAGCRALVADDGLVTLEMSYVGDLVERVEYDIVYHEHLSYFSIASLLRLGEAVNLSAVRIDRFPVHGGSLRVYLSPSAQGHASEVRALEALERRAGLMEVERYRRFANEVRESRDALVGLLERLTGEGRRVAGYGAAAKGNTLLNFCGIDTRLLCYVADRNPRKIGLYTPGTHIPVRDVSTLSSGAETPDYLLILAWNLADEVMLQQRTYHDRGGRFIIPVPRAKVI
ncbi:MAG TPA: class I SAM-dependent methyltransferase [Vicinamibacterales bacterium]|nr:class I SAM-dependent methyltransferase [Vicinamibacterales bacterium]